MPVVNVHDFQMAYDDRGEGLPIIFIHGYPLSRALWQPQIEGLSGAARILAPDLRGHGESEPVSGPYWMDVLAGDISAFMDQVGIHRPAVICGLSMGGYVAMAFFRNHAARIAALILAATRSGPDSEEARANRDKAAELARREGVAAVVEGMLPKMMAAQTYTQHPALVDSVRAMMLSTSQEGVLGDLEGMKMRPDSGPTLAGINQPVLILHGEDDQLIPKKEAESLHTAIRNSRLELIPEAGHLLNLEQPERFNAAIRDFLKTVEV